MILLRILVTFIGLTLINNNCMNKESSINKVFENLANISEDKNSTLTKNIKIEKEKKEITLTAEEIAEDNARLTEVTKRITNVITKLNEIKNNSTNQFRGYPNNKGAMGFLLSDTFWEHKIKQIVKKEKNKIKDPEKKAIADSEYEKVNIKYWDLLRAIGKTLPN